MGRHKRRRTNKQVVFALKERSIDDLFSRLKIESLNLHNAIADIENTLKTGVLRITLEARRAFKAAHSAHQIATALLDRSGEQPSEKPESPVSWLDQFQRVRECFLLEDSH